MFSLVTATRAGGGEAVDPARQDAVARTIVFAIEQPRDVEIGEIVVRPTRQG